MRTAWVLYLSAALFVAVFASCASEPDFPDLTVPSGDFGDVQGTWFGVQTLLGQEYSVTLYLDQTGPEVVGRIAVSLAGAIEDECLEITQRDGRWDGLGISLAYDAATDTLIANYASRGLFDPSARFTLARFSWTTNEFLDDADSLECGLRRPLECANDLDDDGDGAVDQSDRSCCLRPGCRPEGNDESVPGSCEDGLDNDHDGLTDDADPKCAPDESGVAKDEWQQSSCKNGEDDDGDGLVDDEDPDCALGRERRPSCSDEIDNDGDGSIDGEDEGCSFVSRSNEEGEPLLGVLIGAGPCLDGIDNDGDGNADRDDPDCLIVLRGSEASGALEPLFDTALGDCGNGIDDDGDGLLDDDDPGCIRLYSVSQGAFSLPQVVDYKGLFVSYESVVIRYEGTPPCLDGIDNDGDGRVDLNDPGCRFALDWSESTTCDNGVDDDGDGLTDLDDPNCRSASGDEVPTRCDDGVDDDGDGLVDLDDPGCNNVLDTSELGGCEDGLDNDGDGLVDLGDPECTDENANERSFDAIYS